VRLYFRASYTPKSIFASIWAHIRNPLFTLSLINLVSALHDLPFKSYGMLKLFHLFPFCTLFPFLNRLFYGIFGFLSSRRVERYLDYCKKLFWFGSYGCSKIFYFAPFRPSFSYFFPKSGRDLEKFSTVGAASTSCDNFFRISLLRNEVE